MKEYNNDEIEKMASDALKKIHQHAFLCDGEHEEHIFLCGFNAGLKFKNNTNPISEIFPFIDYTFIVRLKNFISDIQVNDMMSFEEKEYIQKTVNKLLEYQKENAVEKYEKDFLKKF